MDGPGKPYLSQPALALTGDDGGGSSRSASTSGSQRLSGTSTWSALGRDHGRMAKSESMPGQRRLSMPATATAPRGVPEIVVSQPRSPAQPTMNVLAPTHAEAPAISNSPPKQHPNSAVSTTTSSPAVPKAPISPPAPIVLPPTPPAATTTTPPTAPRPRTAPPKRAPPKAPSGRPATATPMRIADMPPPVFRMNENGTAQLSPALTTRRSAKPLLNLPLPPLPPPTPAAPGNRRASSLRSMPALSLAGRSDLHMEGDHVNSVLDEDEEGEDEDEEVHTPPTGEGGSDEEGEDLTHPVEPVVPVRTLRRMKLPSIDTARTRAFGKGKTPAPRREGDATPTAAAPSFDYFSVVPQPGPSETPRATAPRPAMYHQVSRSMVNILSPKVEPVPEPASAVEPLVGGKGKGKAPEPPAPAPDYEPASPTSPLRRQRSMPLFTTAAAPPPYPSFAPFAPFPPPPHPQRSVFAIQPREDEGRERLPPYSNAIHLRAVLPRKMEFAAPGVQARDRKWRRALCELEGTAFRVYRVPAGGWWEKAVGAGDAAVVGRMERPAVERGVERPAKLTEDARPLGGGGGEAEAGPDTTTIVLPKPKRLSANLLHPHSHPRSRSHSRSRSDPQEAGARAPLSTPRSSSSQLSSPSSASSSNLASSSSTSSSSSPRGKRGKHGHTDAWADPDPADLIRAYTVQHAESGLGNDYVKRKNVIRVRMEGEQFLLQAQDVADVVEWIEGFHAATNIALDLDERTMPKGPMFPRRRRRRRPREGAVGAAPATATPS
ncbi:hypothetical protein HWV62_15945 [Athelia sp. TMB]|nr:hypothetical protein HWV62_15945 [Athelia sp. TMB]